MVKGSPPYTWGARPSDKTSFFSLRITPIYMGSTKQATIYLTHVQDHPHIHGEHSRPAWRYRTTTGSPPYTWGAQPLNSPFSNWDKDHPHIHGEHPSANRLHDRPSGSPPYTWGARASSRPAHSCTGITPIYMGSTWLA